MPRLLRRVTLLLATAWVLTVTVLFLLQRTLLFPIPANAGLPDGLEIAWVDYAGGRVPMALRGPLDGSAPIVAWFHGNAGQLGRQGRLARTLGEHGISAVLTEFPGYGAATGAGPSETSLLAAGRASLDALARLGAPLPTCVGHSMGSGVAGALAAEGRCDRLVLLAPYTSLPAVAWDHYPFVPTFLLLDRLDTLGRAADIHVPTLVIHGRQDTVVRVEMGRTLAAAIPGARMIERDRNHNSLLDSVTWEAISGFVGGP